MGLDRFLKALRRRAQLRKKMNIITNVWLFPLNWLYLAQDGKLKWILENFLIVSVWLRISCSNSRIRRELVGLLMFTLNSAIAALEARLVVVRLGAEDQALDGDQHLEVRSLCWKSKPVIVLLRKKAENHRIIIELTWIIVEVSLLCQSLSYCFVFHSWRTLYFIGHCIIVGKYEVFVSFLRWAMSLGPKIQLTVHLRTSGGLLHFL